MYADVNKKFTVGAYRTIQIYGDAIAGYISAGTSCVILSGFNTIDFFGYANE